MTDTPKNTVAPTGELNLSADDIQRWGLAPGAQVEVVESPEGLLLRPVDPPIRRVYVEPTTLCNLQCETCVRHSWDEPLGMMTEATWDRLLASLRQTPSLRSAAFWGIGEPLMHPRIADMLRDVRPLVQSTELITNGLLLTRDVSQQLIAAGLDTLVLSADGATAEANASVRDGADLETVRRNVYDLRVLREELGVKHPEIGLEFVMMKSNVDQLPKLRSLAHSLGATFVIVTNLLPYTRELASETLYNLSIASAYTQGRSLWFPEISLPRVDAREPALEPMVQLLRQEGSFPARNSPLSNEGPHCRFVNEGAVAVGWDGRVSPCVALLHSYTCYVRNREKAVRHWAVGNVNEQSLAEIWARPEYVAFRKRVRDFDFSPCADCGGCEYADTNEEDCFGNTFPVCGDCLWARGVIQCP